MTMPCPSPCRISHRDALQRQLSNPDFAVSCVNLAQGGGFPSRPWSAFENGKCGSSTYDSAGRFRRIFCQLDALNVEIGKKYPAYHRLVSPKPIDEQAVRRRLGPHEALLLIVDAGQFTYTFAVSQCGYVWSSAPTLFGEAKSAIDQVGCDLDQRSCPDGMLPSHGVDATPACQLYHSLIEPVVAILRGKKLVYVATSGTFSKRWLRLFFMLVRAHFLARIGGSPMM